MREAKTVFQRGLASIDEVLHVSVSQLTRIQIRPVMTILLKAQTL
jgi:hypothetical protein